MSTWSLRTVSMPAELVDRLDWGEFFAQEPAIPLEPVTELTEAEAWRLLAERFDPATGPVVYFDDGVWAAIDALDAIPWHLADDMLWRAELHLHDRYRIERRWWQRVWSYLTNEADDLERQARREPIYTWQRDRLNATERRFALALLCEAFACEAEDAAP